MKKTKFFAIAIASLLCFSVVAINKSRVVDAAIGTAPTIKYDGELSPTYYSSVENLTGEELLEGLASLSIANHKYYTSYDDCRGGNAYSDKDPNNSNNIIDFYTGWSIANDWEGGETWNREHVWCKSLSGGLYSADNIPTGAGTDIHHIRPEIKSINSARNNGLYTDRENCGNITMSKYYYNGSVYDSYVGQWTGCYNNGQNYWEPSDFVKGDVARILMYLYMHYSKEVEANESYDKAGILKITNICYTKDNSAASAWKMLLNWNALDPVDAFEKSRNNYCASVTGVRNPFIDNASYADLIWGAGGTPTQSYNYDIKTLVKKYYNNGTYQKKTNINLNETAENELKQHFHTGNFPTLQRTTYYKDNNLLMANFDGTIRGVDSESGINSGYGTVTSNNIEKVKADTNNKNVAVGDMTHFKLNSDKNTVTYDYSVPYTESWRNATDTNKGMEGYYITLKDFQLSKYYNDMDWAYNSVDRYYYHNITDAKTDAYLQDFLDLTAPLLLSSIYKETNYLTLDKLVIKESKNTLILQIVAKSVSSGILATDANNVLSEARIYTNITPFDENDVVEEINKTLIVDFSKLGYTNGSQFVSYTEDEISFKAAKNSGSNASAYYDNGTAVRFYGKNTFTIKVNEGYKITSIVIYASSNKITSNNCSITNGKLSNDTITPIDGTKEIVLTNPNTTGNFRIQTITIKYEKIV